MKFDKEIEISKEKIIFRVLTSEYLKFITDYDILKDSIKNRIYSKFNQTVEVSYSQSYFNKSKIEVIFKNENNIIFSRTQIENIFNIIVKTRKDLYKRDTSLKIALDCIAHTVNSYSN